MSTTTTPPAAPTHPAPAAGKEFERKFLVTITRQQLYARPDLVRTYQITQGYLPLGSSCPWAARVRRSVLLSNSTSSVVHSPTHELILKRGLSAVESDELHTTLTPDEYRSWTAQCAAPAISKMRHYIQSPEDNHRLWSVDEFLNPPLRGLLLAEVELPDATTPFRIPDWAGKDVTLYSQYRNSELQAYAAAYPERTEWRPPALLTPADSATRADLTAAIQQPHPAEVIHAPTSTAS